MSTLKFSSWQDLNGNEVANSTYPPGLVLVKSQTIGSGVSSVTVTDAFSSTFDNYRLVMEIGSSTSTGADTTLQLNGATTGYYGSLLRDNYTGTFTGYVRMNNATLWSIGQIDTGWGGCSMSYDIHRPYQTNATNIVGNYFGRGYSGFMSGNGSAAQHTGFVLSQGSGTMTGGTIRVYGYNNG